MKAITVAALAGLLCLSAASAQASSDTAAVKKTITAMFASANKGDAAGSVAAFAKEGTAIDEFAPYSWPDFGSWFKANDSFAAQNGITKQASKVVRFAHVNVEGARAYVVASAIYSYRQGGKLKKENATEVFTLGKDGAAWKIDSFAWLGKAGVDGGSDAEAIIAAANKFANTASASPAPAVIVDEFAPYRWTGPAAQEQWGAALKDLMTKTGGTDLALKLDAPSQLDVNGNNAYAVFPTTITSKSHGKPEVEKGGFAMVFAKDGGWHIAAWTWATK